MKYKRLPTACDLCQTSLREAARELQPSSTYTLHVGAEAYYEGKDIAANAMDQDNPFSPYINLKIDTELKRGEWYIEDEHGNASGSEGACG